MAALPLDAPETFEPSGLWVEQGRLLVISDKHDASIYELSLESDRAAARPFVRVERPVDAPDYLDWEGVSGDGAGGLLLVSESAYRVARVELAGTGNAAAPLAPRWVTPELRAIGEAAGCFGAANAGFEGVARLDADQLLLAIERGPRGLMQVAVDGSGHARAMPGSIYAVPRGRPPDFTDLAVDAGQLYALARNAHLVVRLDRREGSWVEGQGLSYALAENDPRYVYADATFGLGEGLALTADRIFVVLDNNGQARVSAPADIRPLLFVFRRPPGF